MCLTYVMCYCRSHLNFLSMEIVFYTKLKYPVILWQLESSVISQKITVKRIFLYSLLLLKSSNFYCIMWSLICYTGKWAGTSNSYWWSSHNMWSKQFATTVNSAPSKLNLTFNFQLNSSFWAGVSLNIHSFIYWVSSYS